MIDAMRQDDVVGCLVRVEIDILERKSLHVIQPNFCFLRVLWAQAIRQGRQSYPERLNFGAVAFGAIHQSDKCPLEYLQPAFGVAHGASSPDRLVSSMARSTLILGAELFGGADDGILPPVGLTDTRPRRTAQQDGAVDEAGLYRRR